LRIRSWIQQQEEEDEEEQEHTEDHFITGVRPYMFEPLHAQEQVHTRSMLPMLTTLIGIFIFTITRCQYWQTHRQPVLSVGEAWLRMWSRHKPSSGKVLQ